MNKTIVTGELAATLRPRIVRPESREILVSRLAGSDQQADITLPPNCEGLGRIRHFRRETSQGWPENPLPIDPASKALGLAPTDLLTAQVFQNAACAWRCWYCYVPYNLLNGDERRGRWIGAGRLVELYAAEPNRPRVIDLSGGSPDLTPEWVVWMMEALERAGLADQVYLWSDDNLSTDYVFTKLTDDDRRRLVGYKRYGRVCCFKGFDAASFSFNTNAAADAFDRQFEIFRRYLGLGIDLYGYATFTAESTATVRQGVVDFVDRLQALAPNLPLRLVPLRVSVFGPMKERRDAEAMAPALEAQEQAIAVWNDELARRFSADQRALSIADVELYG